MKVIKIPNGHGHALWVILTHATDRNRFMLQPEVWLGPGEYQYVHYDDGRKVLRKTSAGIFIISPCSTPS